MCLPDCQLGGSWGVGYTHTRRVTPCRKRCLEHRISQKGEYRCSCSEQFRGIVVLYLGMSLSSAVSTGSGNPKAFPRAAYKDATRGGLGCSPLAEPS